MAVEVLVAVVLVAVPVGGLVEASVVLVAVPVGGLVEVSVVLAAVPLILAAVPVGEFTITSLVQRPPI